MNIGEKGYVQMKAGTWDFEDFPDRIAALRVTVNYYTRLVLLTVLAWLENELENELGGSNGA